MPMILKQSETEINFFQLHLHLFYTMWIFVSYCELTGVF